MMMEKIWKCFVTNLMTGMITTKVHAPKRITTGCITGNGHFLNKYYSINF